MFSAIQSDHTSPTDTPDIADVRDSVRVLAEVIRHLSERVEILEARDVLRHLRPAEA